MKHHGSGGLCPCIIDMFSVYVYNDVSNVRANFLYVNATCDFFGSCLCLIYVDYIQLEGVTKSIKIMLTTFAH